MTKTISPPNESPLEALPTELLVQIFQFASRFEAAARLATCSKHLYEVWRQHLTPIYNAIAPASILGHSALHSMLADLGHITRDAQPVTLDHIARVVKVSRTGDDLVKDYHRSIQSDPYRDPQVPVNLSLVEKQRFVRAHYQILGLLSLPKAKQQQRIKDLDLKTLFLLSDFLCVFEPQAIMDEDLQRGLNQNRFSHRYLQQELRSRRNKEFRGLYDHAYRPVSTTPYEQGGRYAWWCDCQQQTLRTMLTGRVFLKNDGKVDMSKVRDDMWYDSAEE